MESITNQTVFQIKPNKITEVLKIVIIGNPRVGKTSLRRTILNKNFNPKYHPTLGADFSQKILKSAHGSIQVNMWDLSGQQRFRDVQPQYYVGSDAAIAVYDVRNDNYLEDMIQWIDRYIEFSGNFDTPLMLVQNKIDLLDENTEVESIAKHEELISRLNIYYHKKLKIIGYRTSAKTGENVSASFRNFVNEVIDNKDHSNSNKTLSNQIADGLYTKSSYLMVFDEEYGPVILSKSPQPENFSFTVEELSNAVRLYSVLEFDDLIKKGFRTGKAPWPNEKATIYHIAFCMDNEKIRGGYDLFIIGVAIPDDLTNLIADSQTYIEGYLLNAMNQVEETLVDFNGEVVMEGESIYVDTKELDTNVLTKALYQLRINIDTLIRDLLR